MENHKGKKIHLFTALYYTFFLMYISGPMQFKLLLFKDQLQLLKKR